MFKEFEYRGHEVHATVLPEQGRWAYRIDGAEVHCSRDICPAAEEDALYVLAEAAAKAHIDAAERKRAARADFESKRRASLAGASLAQGRAPAGSHRARQGVPA
jgi:hypothetical protein